MKPLIVPVSIACALTYAFDGFLRWFLNLAHMGLLIYLRDVAILGMILYCFVTQSAGRKNVVSIMGLFWLLAVGFIISLASGLDLVQGLFGLKLFLPLAMGFVLAECGFLPHLNRPKFWTAVLGLLIAGVLAQRFVVLPWTGLVVEVGNYSVVANREWTTNGVARLSGFSRSSFDAATFILLLCCYLICYLRSSLLRVGLWSLSVVAIALTTTKGAFAALGIATLAFPVLFSIDIRAGSLRRSMLVVLVVGFALIGLLAPVFSSQMAFPNLEVGSVERQFFYSMMQRAWDTWPEALALPTGWQRVFGRGLGGIGVSQSLFEPIRYSPADNFFVYCYVTAGLFGVFFYLALAMGVCRLSLGTQGQRLIYVVLLVVFSYGLTLNIIESTPLITVIGCTIHFLLNPTSFPVRSLIVHRALHPFVEGIQSTRVRYGGEEGKGSIVPFAINPAVKKRTQASSTNKDLARYYVR